ncbi:MAG: response regulator transcription factor [Oscillospiraceae bacterium]|jgi:DNA-binding response OmpR family regulator|nr:response regulator transcription factor [Oscillospiraceae bacterium]
MGTILIADDEADIRAVIREYAEFEGYAAVEAADGMEAVALCRERDFDIVIMDAMMPRLDGFSACKEIRRARDIPVLMLSARGEEYDKLFGFEMGADDYVTKPFSPKELMARVNVIVSRSKARGARDAAAPLVFGGLRIDEPGRCVFIDGQRADMTAKEFDLLVCLARNRGIALTRARLLSLVWGYDSFGDERTVDAQIKLLRSKLGEYRSGIVTLRGVGYKFEP